MVRLVLAALLLAGCSSSPAPTAASPPALAPPRSEGATEAGEGQGTDDPPPSTGADLVVHNGRIFTADADGTFVQGLAVTHGEIVYAGNSQGAKDHIGPTTAVVDLGGRLLIPGLHDVHQHTLEAHVDLIDCILSPTARDAEEHTVRLRDCDPNPETDWVLGYGHSVLTLVQARRAPRQILDDQFPEAPVAILEETSHSTWVNTAALELLEIDAGTPDPPGGIIVRDAGGRANGILVDAAGEWPWDLALAQRPELDGLNEQALLQGMIENNEHGITSAVDARVYWERGYLQAYERAKADGALTVRMVLSVWAYPDKEDDAQIAQIGEMFSDDEGLLRVRQVKLYADGLLQNTTAALLAPYETETWGDPLGLQYFDQARLTKYALGLQKVGFDMHIHAIGDRGVREALDAIEASQAAPGGAQARHRLTHAELVDPADVPRFASLGVSVDMQLSEYTLPLRMRESDELIGRSRVDELSWPALDLHTAGANLALSSDYDVSPLNPFQMMEHALDRGDQSLPSVADAVRAYTIAGARIMQSDAWTGTLEVGKRADWVMVSQDLFDVPTKTLGATKALWTVLDGRTVHGGPN